MIWLRLDDDVRVLRRGIGVTVIQFGKLRIDALFIQR